MLGTGAVLVLALILAIFVLSLELRKSVQRQAKTFTSVKLLQIDFSHFSFLGLSKFPKKKKKKRICYYYL